MGRSGNDAISAYRSLEALASVNNGSVNKNLQDLTLTSSRAQPSTTVEQKMLSYFAQR